MNVLRLLRSVSLVAACAALGCDDCERGCDEVYQDCLENNSREECGDDRERCENACNAEDAIWEGQEGE